MPQQLSTCRRPRPSFGIRGGRFETKSAPPSTPTCTHPGARWYPPIHPLRSHYQRFLDIALTKKLTWVGFECRPLRAQQDGVSTDGQHQRFASAFHPSQQLNQKRCEKLLETGIPEISSFFSQKEQAKNNPSQNSIRPITAAVVAQS